MLRVSAFASVLVVCAQSAFATCEFRTSDHIADLNDPSQIESISLKIHNSRKWFQNSFKIITSKSEVIRTKYKSKLDADLTVHYRFGRCVYPARIRQSGDLKDHIAFVNGNPVSSIDVRLKEGNVASAVRFKLLLPETRNGANEVFGTLLFRALGFISPKTFYVDGNVNGVQTRYLFQENAAKEMLEANYRREGPVLEGDESIQWISGVQGFVEQQKLSAARLSNDKWASKGFSSLQIATKALLGLQQSYFEFSRQAGELYGYLNPNGESPNASKYSDYHLLLLATGGLHASSPNNRKFYFNSFLNAYEPIYFDGMLQFTKTAVARELSAHPEDVQLYLTDTSFAEIENLQQRVSELDRESLALVFSHATGESLGDARLVVGRYLDNVALQMVAISNLKKRANTQVSINATDPLESFIKRSQSSKQSQSVYKFEGFADRQDVVLTCLTKSLCADTRVSTDAFIKLLSDNRLNGERAVLAPGTADLSDQTEILVTQTPLGPIQHSATATVQFSTAAPKKLVLRQSRSDDWFLISQTTIESWEIVLEGKPDTTSDAPQGQRFNRFGLTGCLNFYDVAFSGTRIAAKHGKCEDSVNIVLGRGTINSLSVIAGFADAIDIDFSTLHLQNVSVNTAGNDCLDVSSGSYVVGDLNVNNCGDKGVSVGEASTLTAEDAHVQSAFIAASSKDSSVLSFNKLTAKNVTNCLEAFQKKQEFAGARLEVQSLSCAGTITADENSAIRYEEAGS